MRRRAGVHFSRRELIQRARQTADVAFDNTETLGDLTGLKITLGANEIWTLDLLLAFTAGATPDAKVKWTAPNGATMLWADIEASQNAISGAGGTVTLVGGASTRFARLVGTVTNGATAGTLQLQGAQNIATASDITTFLEDSSIVAHKLK